ncbi:MAG: GAF domain-containing protein [Pseudomonadota bacterium]
MALPLLNPDTEADAVTRRTADLLLSGENRILSMLTQQEPLAVVLEQICLLMEAVVPDCLVSILVLDPHTNRLTLGAAPSFPDSYTDYLRIHDIHSLGGPCSSAVSQKAPVIVEDIARQNSSEQMVSQEYRDLALAHDLCSCWSTPLLSVTGDVLGTFGLSFRTRRDPIAQYLPLVDQLTHLTKVALERSFIETRLRLNEACLSEAQRLSHSGSFWWDPVSGVVTWSDETFRIYEFDPALKPSLDLARQRLHPDDRLLFETTAEKARFENEDFVFEHRLLMPDGRVKFVRVVSRAIQNNTTGAVEYLGAVMDVSAEKCAQQALESSLRETRELKEQFRLALDTIPGLVWIALPDGHIDFLNQRWLDFTGLTLDEASGWGWAVAIHPEDIAELDSYWRTLLATKQPGETEARLRQFDGSYRWFMFRAVPFFDDRGKLLHWYGQTTDIHDRKLAEALLAGEKRLLEMVASGNDLSSILHALCHLVEEHDSGRMCSILLVDASGTRFIYGAAPSLSDDYNAALNGRPIDTDYGPCAAAAATRSQILVGDAMTETRWQTHATTGLDSPIPGWRDLALKNGLRACWSTPIFASSSKVLGVFSIYLREPGLPSPHWHELIAQYVHLASIAIERKSAEEALRGSEQFARGQVAALTSTLDALAKESALDKLMEHVLRTITLQLNAHSNSVWLRQQQSGLVGFEYAFENSRLITRGDSELAQINASSTVENFWPWSVVFSTGKPFVLEDIRENHSFPWRDHLLAMGVITILIVPMIMADHVEGVIGIRFVEQRSFRPDELELAQALTNQAMLAMQLTTLSVKSREVAIMEERNRMARDIHDTLAQGFTGVIVQMEAATDAISRDLISEAEKHINRAGTLARESLHEARRSVRALRPQILEDRTLCEALAELMAKMTAGSSMRADFVLDGQPRTLPHDLDKHVLHIGQEVLTNAIRHSGARHFSMRMTFLTDELELLFHDDGGGFDPDSIHEGFGLIGIRERVAAMNGRLNVDSIVGKGTTIAVTLSAEKAVLPVNKIR